MTSQIDDARPGSQRPSPPGTPRPNRYAGSAHTHQLRICLDLQLDALRVAFGAAAADTATHPGPGSGSTPGLELHRRSAGVPADRRPWHRWLVEDIDQAFSLASVMAVTQAGPGGPGPADPEAALEASLDDLAIHHQSVRDLLAELLEGPRRLQPGPARNAAQAARERCEQRIGELRAAMTIPADGSSPT